MGEHAVAVDFTLDSAENHGGADKAVQKQEDAHENEELSILAEGHNTGGHWLDSPGYSEH